MNSPFTLKEFYKARSHLIRDKTPGPSGVTPNQIKAWGPTTMETVFNLSNQMWLHKSVPDWWQDRLITLLPKEPGIHDLTKIRPISLFEVIRKMWASMVSRRVQHVWQDFKILHPNQHGFRWQRGTHTAILHLLDQLEIANEGPPIHLTMWDIRRAFDSVPKWLQRLSWARLGLDYEDLEWFLNLDSTGQAYIRTPAFEASVSYTDPETHLKTSSPMLSSPHSTSFHPERGIGQGDTPSTLLFVAVFGILLTLLDSANTGTPHAYADDLAHIASTLPAQQLQADLVSAFCLLTGLEIASAKVEAITLNGQHLLDSETLVVHDWHWEPHLVVQSNDSFWTRYLGVFLDRSACNKHYHMAKKNSNRLANSFSSGMRLHLSRKWS
jgi:hypothetical protein